MKIKLSDLLQQITPLPYVVRELEGETGRAIVDGYGFEPTLVADCGSSTYDDVGMPGDYQKDAVYLCHAATKPIHSFVVFDIAVRVERVHDIPLVLRTCDRCSKSIEYLGWNIWGEQNDRRSTYCSHCGYALVTKAEVDLAIQRDRVINTSWRSSGNRSYHEL